MSAATANGCIACTDMAHWWLRNYGRSQLYLAILHLFTRLCFSRTKFECKACYRDRFNSFMQWISPIFTVAPAYNTNRCTGYRELAKKSHGPKNNFTAEIPEEMRHLTIWLSDVMRGQHAKIRPTSVAIFLTIIVIVNYVMFILI